MGSTISKTEDLQTSPDERSLIMLNISPGDIYKMWSMMSVTGDQYILKTDTMVRGDNNIFMVEGIGEDSEQATIIHFKRGTLINGKEFLYMQFEIGNGGNEDIYTIDASDGEIHAVKTSAGSDLSRFTSWHPIAIPPPVNVGYFAFLSDKKDQQGNLKELYLSCNGKGTLGLKKSKHQVTSNYAVDVSLLFKPVDP